ncbi:MAG: addiction module protein [Acidobacteria bacterium]|nr:addiction module protein [Acidobacteriota bacterium]
MSISKPLEEMSMAEKIQMMESLWDELCQRADSIESPAWHQDILSQREESLEKGADTFEDWESAKGSIRKQVP